MNPAISRRRAIQTLFCSSAALALNLRPTAHAQISREAMHLLLIGDFGTGDPKQMKVARAMRKFVADNALRPEAMLMLGDNFYDGDKAGFSTESPRWKNEIEDMYPAAEFPGPMWAVLGNHDYSDNPGGEKVQLAYSQKPGVRWRMPAKWYRFELGPASKPLVTCLCLDSNLPGMASKKRKATGDGVVAEHEQQLV
ncbi:MAG TPA: metallophosphoesterase, partial [Luteolibacter sp.]|nr:metallophosphoesterase [Luteolibacter sp.]